MAQIQVTIAGRAYRMACGDGEEVHLEGLAALFDGKIGEMRAAFGEIGDMRLHVMAALTLADELAEARRILGGARDEVAAMQSVVAATQERAFAAEQQIADTLTKASERMERLARSLGPGNPVPEG